MDPTTIPSAEDHSRITVLVRPLGTRQPAVFNRVLERLSRQRILLVSDNPRRIVQARFVSCVSPEWSKFGELQTHRRVLTVVGVACSATCPSSIIPIDEYDEEEEKEKKENGIDARRLPILTGEAAVHELEEINALFKSLKAEHSATVVDSRCVLIGFDEDAARKVFSSRETLIFRSLDESEDLEHGIRDLLRAVYTVLESRRVDGNLNSGKSIDSTAICPILPHEDKLRIGVENKDSKAYRRKVAGRLRKQVADLSLLGGLPREAMEGYAAAAELLRQAGDALWMAGALEGWSAAAISLRYYESTLLESCSINGLHRVSSMTPEQMRHASGERDKGEGNGDLCNHLSAPSYLGHHRWRSDEGSKISLASSSSSLPPSDDMKKKSKIPWAALRKERRGDVDCEEIVEKVQLAMENYSKFSFAAIVEYECMMKAVEVYRRERQLLTMETTHREKVGKYLDDSYTPFCHMTKSAVCSHAAILYKMVNFHRKHAFFSRLSVLFRLHQDGAGQRNSHDYRYVYPVLYRTLSGYGIPERVEPNGGPFCSETVASGPIQLQIRALHEVFTAALRAHLNEAAIRHCCYLLQVYYDQMDALMVSRLFVDLENLVTARTTNKAIPSYHHLGQLLSLDCGIILPPVQMTRFPMINKPSICRLPSHLAPRIMNVPSGPSIFIYSPFEKKDNDTVPVWVVGCACSLSVVVYNCRPSQLIVHDLILMGDGVPFEAVPVRLALSPTADSSQPTTIKMIAVPKSPGQLTLTGYSCFVFGVKNICRLSTPQGNPLQVRVLPELPLLSVNTTLPRAPIDEGDERVAELRVYSGQTFDHSLTVENRSEKMGMKRVRLMIEQPIMTGGQPLVQLICHDEGEKRIVRLREDEESQEFYLSPLEKKPISFRIFGIDPTAITEEAGEGSANESKRQSMANLSLAEQSSLNGITDGGDIQHDLIPYTGRLLVAEFVFIYIADLDGPNGQMYERRGRLRLLISIVPAICVSSWSVLPGDGPFSRYILVDVTNGSDCDAELVYTGTRSLLVQSKETCRVPLLSHCCLEIGGRAFHAASLIDSSLLQREQIEKLRHRLEMHVAHHLDIRWSIPIMKLNGLVPVGALLSSVSLLKQLVLPAISLLIVVNGSSSISEDICISIGEVVQLKVDVVSSLHYDYHTIISLGCTQEVSSSLPSIDRRAALTVIGPRRVQLTVPSNPPSTPSTPPSPGASAPFHFLFRAEGQYKVRPLVEELTSPPGGPLKDDEIFVTPITFNVSTKGVR